MDKFDEAGANYKEAIDYIEKPEFIPGLNISLMLRNIKEGWNIDR